MAELWETSIEAIKSLAVDAAMARALDKRVSALEGVRSSDQDICQVGLKIERVIRVFCERQFGRRCWIVVVVMGRTACFVGEWTTGVLRPG